MPVKTARFLLLFALSLLPLILLTIPHSIIIASSADLAQINRVWFSSYVHLGLFFSISINGHSLSFLYSSVVSPRHNPHRASTPYFFMFSNQLNIIITHVTRIYLGPYKFTYSSPGLRSQVLHTPHRHPVVVASYGPAPQSKPLAWLGHHFQIICLATTPNYSSLPFQELYHYHTEATSPCCVMYPSHLNLDDC